MKGICLLGATGSIGTSTLDVLARHPDRYRVVALTANRSAARLAELCLAHRPRYAVLADAAAAAELRAGLRAAGSATEVLSGGEGLQAVAALDEVDSVVAAIVGAAGLLPALAAARAGKRILLANKEALVMSGQLFVDQVHAGGAELLPVDSEHNAIFQCLPAGFARGLEAAGVRHIVLTASGGPFRTTPPGQLAAVTPDQACAHPNWEMGRKISVDSATMMNKGLEVIEACWLFGLPPARVEVVIHPQSLVHSLVQYADGSLLAQLGRPDMRTAIAHALAWPERIDSGVAPLDVATLGRLEFEPPSAARFPCLDLAYQAARAGQGAAVVLNAANEVAVAAFLSGRLAFPGIPAVIAETLAALPGGPVGDLDAVLGLDAAARRAAGQACSGRGA
ncbi:MAG TPA: 1-deoxy-D-xylulose-5-phosphate reductoisomerase [Gammaproteobacteria bacterium]